MQNITHVMPQPGIQNAESKIQSHLFRSLCLCASVVSFSSSSAPAQWLQFGGPTRDFKVDAKGLANEWPADGPKRFWERELGDGYSAILADGGTLYTMTRRGGDEIVIALEAATGKTIWEHKYPVELPPEMNHDFG